MSTVLITNSHQLRMSEGHTHTESMLWNCQVEKDVVTL